MTIKDDLNKISKEEVKEIAEEKGLIPGIVKNTEDGLQFANKGSGRVNETDWETFFGIMEKKDLAVYSTDEGWMKIMKDEEK